METPAQPAKDRKKAKIRVAHDDQRRLGVQWDAFLEIHDEWGFDAIGVEAYAVGRNVGGNAWKTTLSYQLAVAFGWSVGIPVWVFLPLDLKMSFGGGTKGGKVKVLNGVLREVEGLDSYLEGFSPGKWEHLSDATGHAVLALRELIEWRKSG